MIDDALLEDVMRGAADEVRVPRDGPSRVLAARRPPAPNVTPVRRRTIIATGAAALMIAVAVSIAVSAGHKSPHVALSTGASTGNAKSAGGAANIGVHSPAIFNSTQSALGSGAGSSSSGTAGGSQTQLPNEVPALPSRVVDTGTLDLLVPQGHLTDVIGQLGDLALGEGGFVASSDTNIATSGQAPSGDITLRVPVARFQSLVTAVQRDGTATSVSTSGQDVRSQYVDLQARIQSLDDARTQYEQILSRAQTIGDLLSVEQQISGLQTQIEQLQGQLNVMDDQTTYSTLTVHVTEQSKKTLGVKPPAPPSGISKAWAHARRSFAHGVEAVIGALGGIAVFLLFAGLAAAAARAGWVLVRRRFV
jgi:hypothetical protein